jgi:hypothetical protein
MAHISIAKRLRQTSVASDNPNFTQASGNLKPKKPSRRPTSCTVTNPSSFRTPIGGLPWRSERKRSSHSLHPMSAFRATACVECPLSADTVDLGRKPPPFRHRVDPQRPATFCASTAQLYGRCGSLQKSGQRPVRRQYSISLNRAASAMNRGSRRSGAVSG